MTRRTGSKQPPRAGWFVLAVVGLVVAVAAAIALAVGSGDEVTPSSTASNGSKPTAETAAVVVTGAGLPVFAEGVDPAVGQRAPSVSGVDFDGGPVAFAVDGRATLIVFGAHWCPHCQEEFPKVVEAMRTGALDPDLRVVAVATATSADRPNYPPSSWLARIGWTGDVLVDDKDSTAALAYGVSGFPFVVLLDADGTVLSRAAGAGVPIEQFAARG